MRLTFRFRRSERLKGRDEIRGLFVRGRKVSCSGAKLFYLENNRAANRVAFTFARNYGNAVHRNRSRRLSRESYRLMSHTMRNGYDLVVLVYPGGDELGIRMRQFEQLFRKAGISMVPE